MKRLLDYKKTVLRLALFGCLLCGTAFAQQDASSSEAQPGVFQIGDLTLSAPAGWYQGDVEISPEKDEVRSVLASDEEGRVMVVVTVEPTAGRSLDALQLMTRHFIIMKMDGLVEYEKRKKINGRPALVMVYEGSSAVSEQGRRRFMRTVIERGGYFYILQGVADRADFAAAAGTIEMLANSANWIE